MNLKIMKYQRLRRINLENKVKLNNGTEIEVKAILKDLSDKEFVNMALKRVEPNTSEHCYKKK